jgi:methylmalonyl-CoA mutase N-terminal domain/subunit
LHVDSYDEAYSIPTEQAALLSLRTQQIIQTETGITGVVDPLGGSFYIEALTNDIERRIIDEIDEIEKMGGYVTAVQEGWLHKKVADYIYHERSMIEKGDIKIVGYNIYETSGEQPPIDVFHYPEGVEEKQKARLARLRAHRDNEKVNSALNALGEACRRKKNIVPFTIECARAGCSEGEMFKVFKGAYGIWRPPTIL